MGQLTVNRGQASEQALHKNLQFQGRGQCPAILRLSDCFHPPPGPRGPAGLPHADRQTLSQARWWFQSPQGRKEASVMMYVCGVGSALVPPILPTALQPEDLGGHAPNLLLV